MVECSKLFRMSDSENNVLQEQLVPICKLHCLKYCPSPLSLQWLFSRGWASASFKSFLRPSPFRATIFQLLHPSLATSSPTPSSQRSLGLPLGCFPSGSLRRTLLGQSLSSWRMTCPAHLSLLSLQNFTMSFSPHSW